MSVTESRRTAFGSMMSKLIPTVCRVATLQCTTPLHGFLVLPRRSWRGRTTCRCRCEQMPAHCHRHDPENQNPSRSHRFLRGREALSGLTLRPGAPADTHPDGPSEGQTNVRASQQGGHLDGRRSMHDLGPPWRNSPQSAWASRYASMTLAGMRPLARTCMPWSWAQARTASDSPRGAVLAATPGAARFLSGARFAVAFATADSTDAALVADVRLAAGLLVPLVARDVGPASFRPPDVDRFPDSCFEAPLWLESSASVEPSDPSDLRATRCRP